MASPLSQFEIKKLIPIEFMGYDISFTNSSLAMLSTVILILLFTFIGLKNSAIIPTRGQSLVEISYEFIANMIGDNIGKSGMKYFSFIFSLFMFILLGNLLGMLPYSFHLDKSYNCNIFNIIFYIYCSYHDCNCKTWTFKILKVFCTNWCSKSNVNFISSNRSNFLLITTNKLICKIIRKHDGGSYFIKSNWSFVIHIRS